MGIIVEVFRAVDFPDCTNGGISSRCATLCVVNVEGPSNPTPLAPPVLLESHAEGAVRLVPAYQKKDKSWHKYPCWVMFGGNFAHTSDSRFNQAVRKLVGVSGVAVAIHDRIE